MKKAKDYATEILTAYVEVDDREALKVAVKVFIDLLKESKELVSQRKISKENGVLSILKEQDMKWRAICRRVNKEIVLLSEDGFLNSIESDMPSTYKELIKIL